MFGKRYRNCVKKEGINELRVDLPNFDYEKHKRDIFGLFNKTKIKGMLGDKQGKENWLVLKDKDDWKKAEPILKKLKIKYKLKEGLNEGAWTPAQTKAVDKVDNEFNKLMAKKGIEPYSVEAS